MCNDTINHEAGAVPSVRRAVWLAALGLLVASGAAVAGDLDRAAQGPGRQLSVAVQYGDLDISRDDGVQALYGRLRTAAGKVCEPLKSQDLALQPLWHACYQSALTDAIAQIGNERLAALHASRYQQRVPQRLQVASASE